MKKQKFPDELIVSIENEGMKDDEYIGAATAVDSDRYSDGQKVAVYKLVAVKTVRKTCELA